MPSESTNNRQEGKIVATLLSRCCWKRGQLATSSEFLRFSTGFHENNSVANYVHGQNHKIIYIPKQLRNDNEYEIYKLAQLMCHSSNGGWPVTGFASAMPFAAICAGRVECGVLPDCTLPRASYCRVLRPSTTAYKNNPTPRLSFSLTANRYCRGISLVVAFATNSIMRGSSISPQLLFTATSTMHFNYQTFKFGLSTSKTFSGYNACITPATSTELEGY